MSRLSTRHLCCVSTVRAAQCSQPAQGRRPSAASTKGMAAFFRPPHPPNSIRPGSRMHLMDRLLQHFCFQGLPRKKCLWLGRAPSDQHSITRALPHLKTINTPSLLHSHISKRSTLQHFCTPTSQNDQHSITFALPHLKRINTPSLLPSYISKRSTLHHFYTPTSQKVLPQAAKLPGTSGLFKKNHLLRESSAPGSEAARDK